MSDQLTMASTFRLPLRVEGNDKALLSFVLDANGQVIAEVSGGDHEERAEQIARAVNIHAELIGVIVELAKQLDLVATNAGAGRDALRQILEAV